MKKHLIAGALLLVLVVIVHARGARQLVKTTGERESSPSSSPPSKDVLTPQSSVMPLMKAKKNPACGGAANTNPCGAIKKRVKRPAQHPQAPTLTVSQSDLVSTSTRIDRSDYDPIGPRAFVLDPHTPQIALIHINGIETAVKNTTYVAVQPRAADYSPGWGNPGTQITVDGSGFGQTQGTSVLQVLSSVTNTWTNLPVTSWTDTRIIATIPETMPIGKVYLDVIVGPALTAGGLESIGTFPSTQAYHPF